jgi:hypothetical protein
MAPTRRQLDNATPPVERGATDDRREFLARRLDDGFQRIDEAALAGADVTEWESFWIKLLREYEDVCHQRERAA